MWSFIRNFQFLPRFSLSPTHQSKSFTCLSQSLRRCMQRFDKQYTFPSTGGDVALSCSAQCVSEVHLAEMPLLPDSDECCCPATQPTGCWSGLNLLFLYYLIGFHSNVSLPAVCHFHWLSAYWELAGSSARLSKQGKKQILCGFSKFMMQRNGRKD